MASDRIKRQIERLLDQLEEAVEQRNWQLVRQLAEDVLVLDPDNADASPYLSAAERALEPNQPEGLGDFIPEQGLRESVFPGIKPATDEGRSEVPRKEWSAGIGAMLCGGVIYGFLWSLTIFLIPDGRVDFIFTIGDYLIDGITYTRIADIGWFLVMLLILLAHQKELQPDAWKFHIGKFLPGWLASLLAKWLKEMMLVGVFVIHFMYLRSLELGFLESVF